MDVPITIVIFLVLLTLFVRDHGALHEGWIKRGHLFSCYTGGSESKASFSLSPLLLCLPLTSAPAGVQMKSTVGSYERSGAGGGVLFLEALEKRAVTQRRDGHRGEGWSGRDSSSCL